MWGDDWNAKLEFVRLIAKRVNMGPQGTHIALVRSGEPTETVFDFWEFSKTPFKEQTILQKITFMTRPRVGEFGSIYKAVTRVIEVLNRRRFGMRSNVKKVYLILF